MGCARYDRHSLYYDLSVHNGRNKVQRVVINCNSNIKGRHDNPNVRHINLMNTGLTQISIL